MIAVLELVLGAAPSAPGERITGAPMLVAAAGLTTMFMSLPFDSGPEATRAHWPCAASVTLSAPARLCRLPESDP